jgi:hypothetical protein
VDEFFSPFGTLEQVRAWAETRNPELVGFAAIPRRGDMQRKSAEIDIRAGISATQFEQAGRDIDAEFWAASTWTPKARQFVAPSFVERESKTRGIPTYELMFEKGLRVERPKAPADDASQAAIHGPPFVFIREPFPTIKYLEHLFRSGRLAAIGNLPNDPRAKKISGEDWAVLEIACGGDFDRMTVWRAGRVEDQGRGDFENVSVKREDVLREFPAEAVTGQPAEICSDVQARALIRAKMTQNGGFVGQEAGAEFVRARYPKFPKKHAMKLVQEETKNRKPGPKGPRRKSCG